MRFGSSLIFLDFEKCDIDIGGCTLRRQVQSSLSFAKSVIIAPQGILCLCEDHFTRALGGILLKNSQRAVLCLLGFACGQEQLCHVQLSRQIAWLEINSLRQFPVGEAPIGILESAFRYPVVSFGESRVNLKSVGVNDGSLSTLTGRRVRVGFVQ